MSYYNFTDNEWETCIKVLTALKDDPMQNPDNQTFKTLIKKIYKKARKIEHHQALSEKENNRERVQEETPTQKLLAALDPHAIVKEKKKEQPGMIRNISDYFGF